MGGVTSWWAPGLRADTKGATTDVHALWAKLSVRCPDELKVRLKVAAARGHTSEQALVIEALESHLERLERTPPAREQRGR